MNAKTGCGYSPNWQLLSACARMVGIVLLFITASFSAYSNGAFYSSSQSGELTTEPFVKKYCRITTENLFIDLTPITQNRDAEIVAEYNIFLERAIDSLMFIFVAASRVSDDIEITIDGRRVAVTKVREHLNLPNAKFPVVKNPWGEPDRGYDWSESPTYFNEEYVFAKLSIPEGHHRMTIRYKTRLTKTTLYPSQSKTRIHTLSYAVYPAREWESLGEFNITIKVPDAWDVETNLGLSVEHNLIKATYKEIPEDFIHIHIRYPEAKAAVFLTLYDVLTLICLLAMTYAFLRIILRAKTGFIRYIGIFLLSLVVTILFVVLFLSKENVVSKYVSGEIIFPSDRAYVVLGAPFFFLIALVFVAIFYATLKRFSTYLRRP